MPAHVARRRDIHDPAACATALAKLQLLELDSKRYGDESITHHVDLAKNEINDLNTLLSGALEVL